MNALRHCAHFCWVTIIGCPNVLWIWTGRLWKRQSLESSARCFRNILVETRLYVISIILAFSKISPDLRWFPYHCIAAVDCFLNEHRNNRVDVGLAACEGRTLSFMHNSPWKASWGPSKVRFVQSAHSPHLPRIRPASPERDTSSILWHVVL